MGVPDSVIFEEFFDQSIGLLAIGSPVGYFERLSPQWSHLLGFSLDELRAVPFMEFVHPDDRAATLAEIQVLANGDHPTIACGARPCAAAASTPSRETSPS